LKNEFPSVLQGADSHPTQNNNSQKKTLSVLFALYAGH